MARATHLRDADAPKSLRTKVIAALWTRTKVPLEYLELILCRDVFHCPPTVLYAQPTDAIMNALACLSAEEYVREQERRVASRGH